MRLSFRLSLFATLMLASFGMSRAQNASLEQLRSQLDNIKAQEAELQARDKRLDEEMRPENIERSLALTGSTRPEELREQRRRQLQKEKDEVRSQLDQLAASRARLEAAIVTAESAAYRQSAGEIANPQAQTQNSNSNQVVRPTTNQQRPRVRRPRRKRTRRRG